MTLENWEDIKEEFKQGSLIVGNGFSIGINDKFAYESLQEEAKKESLSENLCNLAEELRTGTNFELLLRQLYTTKIVNEKLDLDTEGKVECNYAELRSALITTIKAIHCEHSDVDCELRKRIDFLKHFNTVFSLSYDLLVYWIINLNNRIADNNEDKAQKTIKDCFDREVFSYDDWEKYRKPYLKEEDRTLVFYPHGALHLLQTEDGSVKKIVTGESRLLEAIEQHWQNNVPLFVSEGDSEEKSRSILGNRYLQTIYHQIFPNSLKKGKQVIFGWEMSEFDEHLIKIIISAKPRKIAIGIHIGNETLKPKMENKLRPLVINDTCLKFFSIDQSFC